MRKVVARSADPEKLPGWSYMLGVRPPPPPPRQDYGGTLLLDGRLAASVALTGTLGTGKRMLLDDEVWSRVRAALGTVWGLREAHNGAAYVVGKVKASAGPGLPSTPVLARWVARAKAGQVVTYRNGDALDLRAINLAVVGREEFMRDLGVPEPNRFAT